MLLIILILFNFMKYLRTKNMFFDIGIVHTPEPEDAFTESITPYPGAEAAEIKTAKTAATFSVGFFF